MTRRTLLRLVDGLGGTRLGVLVIGRVISPLQRSLYRGSGGVRSGAPVVPRSFS